MKILSSLRVVEISALGPGPFCAMHLADLGADVISVSRPEEKDTKSILYRGKRSVVADLKTSEGKRLIEGLIKGADVLIEGMRPGVMERLGLGPEDCHKINPRLVYGRMTGWGQDGPLAHAAGHDNNYISVSGALWHSGQPDTPPLTPFASLGDIGGGAMYLAVGILSGVLHARETGKGTVVDAAIVDGSAHMLNLLLKAQSSGYVNDERGTSIHDSSPFYQTYECADGQYITLGSIEPQFFDLLLKMLGLEEDPLFKGKQWDRASWHLQRARLAGIIRGKNQADWQALFEGTDVCFGVVLSPTKAATHPHNQARGIYFERDGVLQASPAPRFDGQAYRPGAVTALGQHTQEIQEALAKGDAGAVWLS